MCLQATYIVQGHAYPDIAMSEHAADAACMDMRQFMQLHRSLGLQHRLENDLLLHKRRQTQYCHSMQKSNARSGRKLSRLPPMVWDARLKGRASDAPRTSALAPAPAQNASFRPAGDQRPSKLIEATLRHSQSEASRPQGQVLGAEASTSPSPTIGSAIIKGG